MLAWGKVFGAAIAVGAGVFAALPAAADDRVMAVVNDTVITESQLNGQCDLREATMPPDTRLNEGQKRALCRRTLLQLIETELQKQFADGNGLALTKDEIKAATEKNKDILAKLPARLQSTAREDMLAEIRWQKIINARVRPTVQVGKAEVDRLIDEMAKQRQVNEREIAQILLVVGSAADEAVQKAKMEDIQKKVAAGEDFSQLARAFSDATEGVAGGRMGWFASGQLNPQLEGQLDKMKPGEVSGLIRTPLGWHLVKLLNVRESKPIDTAPVPEVRLLMVAAPAAVEPAAGKGQQEELAKLRKAKPDEAAVLQIVGAGKTGGWPASRDLGWVQMPDLQPEIAAAIKGLKPGQLSEPVTVNGNVGLVFLASERQVMPRQLMKYRERVYNHLFQNRVEQEARRLMRHLQQRAFVDVRA